MYYPEYIPLLIFLLGAILATVVYVIRINKVRKGLNVLWIELYDKKYSDAIKKGLKGVTRIQIFLIIGFIILAIIFAIINRQ